MRLKDIPYIFNPVYVGNKIYIRKKILSKGYDVLEGVPNYDAKLHNHTMHYKHIKTIPSLERVEKYIWQKYNIKIKL